MTDNTNEQTEHSLTIKTTLAADEHAGTVKWFCPAKGYGFIAADQQTLGGTKDIFIHSSTLKAAGLDTLGKQARVCFTLGKDRAGRYLAKTLRVL